MKNTEQTILLHMKQLVRKFDEQPGLAIQTMNFLKPSDFIKFLNQLNQANRGIRIIALELLLHFFLNPSTLKSSILQVLNLNYGLIILNNIPLNLCKNAKKCKNILETVQRHYKKLKAKGFKIMHQNKQYIEKCWLYCFATQQIKEYKTLKKQRQQIDPYQYLVFMQIQEPVQQRKIITNQQSLRKTKLNHQNFDSILKQKNIMEDTLQTKYIKPALKLDRQNR